MEHELRIPPRKVGPTKPLPCSWRTEVLRSRHTLAPQATRLMQATRLTGEPGFQDTTMVWPRRSPTEKP